MLEGTASTGDLLINVVLLYVWSVLISVGFYKATSEYRRMIKNLKTRVDNHISLLTRVADAFNSVLDKSEENDNKILNLTKRFRNISDEIKQLQKRISIVEQYTNIPTEQNMQVRPKSKARPKIQGKFPSEEEFPDDEEVQIDRGEVMEPVGSPDYVVPQAPQPSRAQRRGNPTGRVQL